MHDEAIEMFNTENWMIAKVVGKDDYRFGAYLQELNQRSIWSVDEKSDLTCTLDELQDFYNLIGKVLSGERGQPYPPTNGEEE